MIALLAVSSSAQKTSYDNNVLFVLDLSYSMNAQDISTGSSIDKITRLEAAKQIIKQAVEA